jgi:hypothetical protein
MLEDFQVDVTCLVRNMIKPDDRPSPIVLHGEASLVNMHLLATVDACIWQNSENTIVSLHRVIASSHCT